MDEFDLSLMPRTVVTPDEIRAQAAVNLNVFAGIVMPDIAIYRFPPFYQELWLLCIKSFMDLSPTSKLFKLLLILPRGHAKTTFIKLLVAYCIIHRLANFVMVLCASDGNATDFMNDVSTLLSHDNVRQLYGDWEAGTLTKNDEQIRARFMGRIVLFKAASILSGRIRGSQKDMQRPDAIIFDDVQTKEVAESEKKTLLVEEAIIGTAMKAKSPHRCGIIYLGNSYPRNCIAQKLADSGQFITLKTGGVLANKTALWEELHSLQALMEEWRLDCALGKGHIWMAEVQNQPLEREGVRPLFPEGNFPLTVMDREAEGLMQLGAFVTVDPAGRSRTSDDTAIGGHVIWEDNRFELAHLEGDVLDPKQTIERAVLVAEAIGAPVIFIEAVAYQESLCFWGDVILEEMGLLGQFQFHPISTGGVAKLARIRAWVGELLAGQYVITNPEIKSAILYQGIQFDASRTDNKDDRLDTSAYGTVVRNKHLELVLQAYRTFHPSINTAPRPVATKGALAKRLQYAYSTQRIAGAGCSSSYDSQRQRYRAGEW